MPAAAFHSLAAFLPPATCTSTSRRRSRCSICKRKYASYAASAGVNMMEGSNRDGLKDSSAKNYGLEGPQAVVNVAIASTVFIVDFFATVTKKLLYDKQGSYEYNEEIPTLAAIARASAAKQAGLKALQLARSETAADGNVDISSDYGDIDTAALLERARCETDAVVYQLDSAQSQASQRRDLLEKLFVAKGKADSARDTLRDSEKKRRAAETMRDGDTDLKSAIAAAEFELQDLELKLEAYRAHSSNTRESKRELELLQREMDAVADEKAAELRLIQAENVVDTTKYATEKLRAEITHANTLRERREAQEKRKRQAVQDVLDGVE